MIRRILREPLVHFLLIGAVLFALYRITGSGTAEPAQRIVIGTGEVERLALTFSRLWMRPPTAEELRGLIDKEIREEVFYREAMTMGLDRDDTIIRRRLQQKLEFLSEDVAAQQKPTEAQLQAYLESHPEKFRAETTLTFRQVYVNRDHGAADAERRAERLLGRLRTKGAAARIESLGDRISLPSDVDAASERDVFRDFGAAFTAKIATLPLGHWEGPAESGYGLHLVLLKARVPGGTPPLAQVREAVLRECNAERRNEFDEDFYKALRSKYVVSVELPSWARKAAPAADRVQAQ